MNPLEKQVGGDHYKDLAIQPVEYCERNRLGMCASNVVKYVTRYKSKGGKQDLEKAKHFIDLLLIQLEYSEDSVMKAFDGLAAIAMKDLADGKALDKLDNESIRCPIHSTVPYSLCRQCNPIAEHKPHNPDNLPSPGEGYRFLDKDEIVPENESSVELSEIEWWSGANGRWLRNWKGCLEDATYRTRLSREELAKRRAGK